MEQRLLRIENLLHISDEMHRLACEQDGLTGNNINRRMQDFENRLRTLEANNSQLTGDVERTLEQREALLTGAQDLRQELNVLQRHPDKVAALEQEMNEKMVGICESIEELARRISEKDQSVQELKHSLRVPNKKLVDKLSALLGLQEDAEE